MSKKGAGRAEKYRSRERLEGQKLGHANVIALRNCAEARSFSPDRLVRSLSKYAGSQKQDCMARISGLEHDQAPWHLRWFYRYLQKMFGKVITPVKLQARVPGIVWGSIGLEAGLGRKRRVSLRFTQLAKVRTAARVGCPF